MHACGSPFRLGFTVAAARGLLRQCPLHQNHGSNGHNPPFPHAADPYFFGSGQPGDHVISATGTLASFGRGDITIAPEAPLASGGGDGTHFFVPLAGNALSTSSFPAGTFDMDDNRGATFIIYARFPPGAPNADIFTLEEPSGMVFSMRLRDGGDTLQCRLTGPSLTGAAESEVATGAAVDDDWHSFGCTVNLPIISGVAIVQSRVGASVDGSAPVTGQAGGRPNPETTPSLVRLGDGSAAASEVSIAVIYTRELTDEELVAVHAHLAAVTSAPLATADL